MALPGTNAETPIDSHRLDGSLWKPRSILSYPEGHFNPPSDLTLTFLLSLCEVPFVAVLNPFVFLSAAAMTQKQT